MATVEERKYEESEVYEEIEKSHTDRDIVKGHPTFKFEENEEDKKFDGEFNMDRDIVEGHTTTFEFDEDEEFAKVFNTTTFEFEENEEFDKMFNTTTFEFKENEEDEEFNKVFNMVRDIAKGHITVNFEEYEEDEEVQAWTRNEEDDRDGGDRAASDVGQNSDPPEVPRPLLRGGCNQEQFESFTQQWSLYAGSHGEMDGRELRQQLLNCADGPLEATMYDALGGTTTSTQYLRQFQASS